MDTQQFSQYLVIFGGAALIFDIFYTYRLAGFLKLINLPNPIRILPWVIMPLAFISIVYNLYLRIYGITPDTAAEYLFYFAVTWYAPKFFISPFLILNSLHKYLAKRISRKPRKYSKVQNFIIGERKSFTRDTAWLLSFMPYFIIIHSFIATTYNFRVHEIDIPIEKKSTDLNNLKIVHISDLHAGSFSSPGKFGLAVDKINALNPDIIVITGDFVNFHHVELAVIGNGLKDLKSKYGIFGCLGNHDHYMYPDDHKELIDSLEASGMDILINEHKKIAIGRDTLLITGVDNISYRHSFGDLESALEGSNPDLPAILLMHDPFKWTRLVKPSGRIDLTLGGHTHGGQIVLDACGDTLSHMRLRYIHWRGYYNENGHQLYLTSGIGTVGIPFRFGVRPEITLIRLKTLK